MFDVITYIVYVIQKYGKIYSKPRTYMYILEMKNVRIKSL